MEPPLLKAILERVILFFVPIALGYAWRWATEGRRERAGDQRVDAAAAPAAPSLPAPTKASPMRTRTLLWLAALGAVLVVASLIGGVLLPHAPDQPVYVPAEVQPGGGVTPGRFEAPQAPRKPASRNLAP